jgi:hypothetical protein
MQPRAKEPKHSRPDQLGAHAASEQRQPSYSQSSTISPQSARVSNSAVVACQVADMWRLTCDSGQLVGLQHAMFGADSCDVCTLPHRSDHPPVLRACTLRLQFYRWHDAMFSSNLLVLMDFTPSCWARAWLRCTALQTKQGPRPSTSQVPSSTSTNASHHTRCTSGATLFLLRPDPSCAIGACTTSRPCCQLASPTIVLLHIIPGMKPWQPSS